jgi:hypothetical protein
MLRWIATNGLLAGDHPLAGRDGRGQAVERGRLAGLGRPGDDRRLQEPGALAAHGSQPDELGQGMGAEHEPPDVDHPVAPGDVGDDDVEPGAVGEGRVHERTLSQISTRHSQRPGDGGNRPGPGARG